MKSRKKVMVVFGTRPEAIKMAPVIKELEKNSDYFETSVCVTGQHREMLDQVLDIFQIKPDYDLSVMMPNQSLFELTTHILGKIKEVLEEVNPDVVLVHGDTTTTYITALAAFYLKIPVGHVEAGLRTRDIYSPFPEEFNRHAVSIIAKWHFAPTEQAKENLIQESINPDNIFVTGNTAIDVFKYTIDKNYTSPLTEWIKQDEKLILLTAHRRENLGEKLENIFRAILEIVESNPKIKVIYPVHLNPVIKEMAHKILGNNENIKLIKPLDVYHFHNLMAKSNFILTDSGGIQEEAPHLNKPVLVLRDITERPEGVKTGTLKLVGTSTKRIVLEIERLIENSDLYLEISHAKSPFGDGNASKYIINVHKRYFEKNQ